MGLVGGGAVGVESQTQRREIGQWGVDGGREGWGMVGTSGACFCFEEVVERGVVGEVVP